MTAVEHHGIRLEHSLVDGWHVFVAPDCPGAAAARRDREEALAAAVEAVSAIREARAASGQESSGAEEVLHAGRIIPLTCRRIGDWSAYVCDEYPGLYSAHRDRGLALASVPSALEMIDRITARIAARQGGSSLQIGSGVPDLQG